MLMKTRERTKMLRKRAETQKEKATTYVKVQLADITELKRAGNDLEQNFHMIKFRGGGKLRLDFAKIDAILAICKKITEGD